MSDVRSVKRLIEVYYREIHSIEDLAQLTKYSSETLRKDFVRWEGITLSDFITKTRVEKAKERLERTDLTCREICYAVGFSREEVGERAFSRLTGKSMKEHREFSQRQISSGDPASHVTPWDGNQIPLKSTSKVNR